ncbi:MAG TPA: penicillin-binding transpeptidase domain-containing protein, partial [Phycisphaerae bacterium]|nr:penicillin-binding transpeptidase domain-containing protein [Phycisphaerae bacterium]
MYKRRIKIFLGLVAVVFAVMIARLGYLQILRGDDYRLQAEEALQKYELLPARRGRILDRTGECVLAKDEACTDLCLHYRFLTADEKWIRVQQNRIRKQEHVSPDEARQIYQDRARRTWQIVEEQARERNVDLPTTIEEIVRRVERIRAGRDYDVREQNQEHPVLCALDNETAVRLKPQLEDTVGLALRSTHKRVHPFGDLACHVIGMTGRVWAEDLEERNLTAADEPDWLERLRRNYQPWDTIGRRGVEAMCENILRGVRGSRRLKRIGTGVQVLEEVPAGHGHDVHLTLDLRLQQEGVAQLHKAGYTGCVVILSVPLGEVLALVSVPTFDLNRYSQDYEILAEETLYLPLLHRAVGRRYSPGSTIKPLMALAGLGAGVIGEHTTYNCQGSFDPRYPDRFRCWNRNGHGSEDLRAALRDSCDVYFYHVGQLLGLDKAAPWLNQFGYGDLPGTGLPDERAGLVPTVDWMRRHGRTAELRGEARLEGIGQGVIEATPLH